MVTEPHRHARDLALALADALGEMAYPPTVFGEVRTVLDIVRSNMDAILGIVDLHARYTAVDRMHVDPVVPQDIRTAAGRPRTTDAAQQPQDGDRGPVVPNVHRPDDARATWHRHGIGAGQLIHRHRQGEHPHRHTGWNNYFAIPETE